MTTRKAFVSEAAGYVGTKLCQRLLAAGWQVDVIVRELGSRPPVKLVGKAKLHSYDGSTRSVMDAVTEANPDVVFHLASLFIAEHEAAQIEGLVQANILFGTHLIEACARTGIKYFINTGTSWQHYRSHDYDPVCLYAATKQAFEDILDFYADAFSLRVITLKLFDTYGPDDPRAKLVNLLLRAVKTGEDLGMSPGEQILDLVHIDDVTRAFEFCAEQLIKGVIVEKHVRYSVSSGRPVSVRQLVAILKKVSKKTINVSFGKRPYREREVMSPWVGGQAIPGWSAVLDLETGLSALFLSHEQGEK